MDILNYLCDAGYQLWDISSFLYTRNDRLWAANSIFLSETLSTKLEKLNTKKK